MIQSIYDLVAKGRGTMMGRGLIGAIMVVAAIAVPTGTVQAQQAPHSQSRLIFDPHALNPIARSADAPAASVPVAKPVAAPNPAKPNSASRPPLRLDRTDTTTGTSRVRPQNASSPSTHSLGRIPLGTGSFGIKTETKLKGNEFPDGRRIPGLVDTHRTTPTYFGLSLSAPTESKSFHNEPPLRSHSD